MEKDTCIMIDRRLWLCFPKRFDDIFSYCAKWDMLLWVKRAAISKTV